MDQKISSFGQIIWEILLELVCTLKLSKWTFFGIDPIYNLKIVLLVYMKNISGFVEDTEIFDNVNIELKVDENSDGNALPAGLKVNILLGCKLF